MFSFRDLGITYKKSILANGTRVSFFIKKDNPPSISIVFPIGSADDPIGKKGLTHLFEHTLLLSSINNSEDLSLEFAKLGGWFNAYTSEEELGLCAQFGSSEDLDKALSMLSRTFLKYEITQEQLENEKLVVLQELESESTNPDLLLDSLSMKVFFRESNYASTIIGNPSDITSITIADLRAFAAHLQSITPIIIITGDVNPAAVLPLLSRYFNLISLSPTRLQQHFRLSQVLVHPTSQEFINARIGYSTCSFLNTKDWVTLKFIAFVLGGGLYALLPKTIRNEKGLVYDISCKSYGLSVGGVFYIDFGTTKQNFSEVVESVFSIMSDIRSNGFDTELIAEWKTILVKSAKVTYEDPYSVGYFHITGELYAPDVYLSLDKYMERILSISNDDVISVAKKYLTKEHLGMLAIGDISADKLSSYLKQ